MGVLSKRLPYIATAVFLLAVFTLAAIHLYAPSAAFQSCAPPPRAAPGRVFYRDRVMVLMFHNISPTTKGRGTITPAAFAADIRQLVRDGFQPVTAAQLAAFLRGKGEVPPNAVAVTFDDGYAGTYTYAFPVLREYRVPATVFLIAGYVGRSPDFLTWSQVREMEASGLFAFGGHTFDAHYRARTGPRTSAPASVARIWNPQTGRRETAVEYRARMLADSLRAQGMFRRELGHTTPYFAYPYGAYNPEFDGVLRDAGYRYYFTVLRGVNRKGQGCRVYRINAGAPWVSPRRLVTTMRVVALAGRWNSPPPTWLPRWAGDSFFRRHGFAVSGQESRKGSRETAGVLNERPRARRLRRTRGLFNSAW
ncbi:MAG: polysaccharide deacetylase family protein [Desulfotomaculales bacterium]